MSANQDPWVLKDEAIVLAREDGEGRPRDLSLRDVMVKLEEMERRLVSVEQMLEGGVCSYGADY